MSQNHCERCSRRRLEDCRFCPRHCRSVLKDQARADPSYFTYVPPNKHGQVDEPADQDLFRDRVIRRW